MNINEVEPQLAQKLDGLLRKILRDLSYSLPENYQPQVSLLDANRRKKNRNAAANNWSPESGRIEIRFESVMREDKKSVESPRKDEITSGIQSQSTASTTRKHLPPAEIDLLKALDRAESKPGWNFVPLKKFPVTTIRLNRLLPEVKAALGKGDNADLEFRPIEIHGEPLSTTILRERR